MRKGGIHETVLRLVGKGSDEGQVKSASAGATPPDTMDKTAALVTRLRELANEDAPVEKPASGLQEKLASLAPEEPETAPEGQGAQLLLARIHALSEARNTQVKSASAEVSPEPASPPEGASTPDVRSKIRDRVLAIKDGKGGVA